MLPYDLKQYIFNTATAGQELSPSPSPTPGVDPTITNGLENQLGVEIFLILVCVLIICYMLGLLTLHAISWARKSMRARRNSDDHASIAKHLSNDYDEE